MLKDHGIKISMSAKGNPYDNAYVESFFKTLKQEEVYLWQYETYFDVITRIPDFIEDVYNRKRLHSASDFYSFLLDFLMYPHSGETFFYPL